MKRISAVFLCLLVVFGMALTVSAAQGCLINDYAGLLTDVDISMLEEQALELKEAYGIEPVIVTVDSLDGKNIQAYADDYYDQNGYGEDGVLMLLAMEEREWYISTSGEVIYALTDYALYQMEDSFLSDLQDGDYYSAFYSYLWDVGYYMDEYKDGAAVDGYIPEEDRYEGHTDVVYREESTNWGTSIAMGCGVGLIVAGIAILIMRGTMNTKQMQHSAGDYLKQGSFHMHRHQDLFLYSNVTKHRKPEHNSSGGGGSGVHRSASGRSHGGRGGKF